jgi:hypothetical protein
MIKNSINSLFRKPRRFYAERAGFLSVLPRRSVGIELGVFRGEFSRYILQIVKPRALHLVDVWWTEFGEYYPDWGSYTDYGRLRTEEAYLQARQVVDAYGGSTDVYVHAGDDLEYLASLPDGSLDWAYIDSSHMYEHTKQELELLGEKIRIDGLISGHDWREDPNSIHHGVFLAVTEFCSSHGWEVIALDNNHQWALRRKRTFVHHVRNSCSISTCSKTRSDSL